MISRQALLLAAIGVVAAPPDGAAAKYSSIVIEEKSGAVLHAVNPDTRHYPASLTKMMTLYLVFEALDAKRFTLDSRITVSRRAARQPASKLDLKPRERISIRDVILGLAVKSANDAAAAVAEAIAGTERKFGRLMSAKARALGMTNTRFRNASGLPNRRQLTTARDLAILVRALKRDFPQYYRYFNIRTFSYKGQRHVNHNRLLDRYAGADGVKTGFIRASGFNLAASAERDGIRLIAVVLGARSPRARDLHTMGLLERGFEKATGGRHTAFHYDRNIRVSRDRRRVNKRVRVRRAPGARGRIRLSRLIPPRRPETLSASEQGSAAQVLGRQGLRTGWTVQVGTFTRVELSQLALRRARSIAPEFLARVRAHVRPVATPGATLYRAEFLSLDAEAAERICARLAATGHACLALPPGAGTGDEIRPDTSD